MALVTEIEARGTTLVVYNAHLESRGPESLRLSQLEEILADSKRYPPEFPVIVAGDLNTRLRPSPLITRIDQAGFRNALGKRGVPTILKGGFFDWIFACGPIEFEGGRVHREIVASDHYPLPVCVHSLSGS